LKAQEGQWIIWPDDLVTHEWVNGWLGPNMINLVHFIVTSQRENSTSGCNEVPQCRVSKKPRICPHGVLQAFGTSHPRTTGLAEKRVTLMRGIDDKNSPKACDTVTAKLDAPPHIWKFPSNQVLFTIFELSWGSFHGRSVM
jgi:hypothetical protein